jgi:heme/copper-type cytochrome/quinol oxidase subunit 2
MYFTVEVVDQSEFDDWVATEEEAVAEAATEGNSSAEDNAAA